MLNLTQIFQLCKKARKIQNILYMLTYIKIRICILQIFLCETEIRFNDYLKRIEIDMMIRLFRRSVLS